MAVGQHLSLPPHPTPARRAGPPWAQVPTGTWCLSFLTAPEPWAGLSPSSSSTGASKLTAAIHVNKPPGAEGRGGREAPAGRQPDAHRSKARAQDGQPDAHGEPGSPSPAPRAQPQAGQAETDHTAGREAPTASDSASHLSSWEQAKIKPVRKARTKQPETAELRSPTAKVSLHKAEKAVTESPPQETPDSRRFLREDGEDAAVPGRRDPPTRQNPRPQRTA